MKSLNLKDRIGLQVIGWVIEKMGYKLRDPGHILCLQNEKTTYIAFKFQVKRIEDITEVEEMTKDKRITIGTIYHSVPF